MRSIPVRLNQCSYIVGILQMVHVGRFPTVETLPDSSHDSKLPTPINHTPSLPQDKCRSKLRRLAE